MVKAYFRVLGLFIELFFFLLVIVFKTKTLTQGIVRIDQIHFLDCFFIFEKKEGKEYWNSVGVIQHR